MTRGSSTRCGNGRLLVDELARTCGLWAPQIAAGRSRRSSVMKSDTPEHLAVSGHCAVNMDAVAEIGQVRLPCILRGTPCGRCLRQAKTCCSDERFLLENVPVRARGRRAHDRCTREVELDDGGQTLMINYYSALLYCDKILNRRQKSLVRATRSAALTKQKVTTC